MNRYQCLRLALELFLGYIGAVYFGRKLLDWIAMRRYLRRKLLAQRRAER